MEKQQIAIIVVGVLVLGSIIGGAMVGSRQSRSGDVGEEPEPEPEPASFSYKANGVDANVERLLPSLQFVANTDEKNILVIEEALSKVQGVRALRDSRFGPPQAGQEGLVYFSIIITEQDHNFQGVVEGIEENTPLSNVQAMAKGLLKMPTTIHLSNTDLNLEIDHTFEEPFAEALVNLGTEKGDRLKINLEVTLKGSELVKMAAYEVANESAQLKTRNTKLGVPIASLRPNLVFAGTLLYTGFDKNKLQEDLAAEADINWARIEFQYIKPAFELSIPLVGEDANQLKEKVELALEPLEEISSTDSSLDENFLKIAVEFKPEADYVEVRDSALTALEDQGIDVSAITVTDPLVSLQGEVTFTPEDSSAVAEKVAATLAVYGITFETNQLGFAEVAQLVDPSTNEAFDVEEPLETILKPGHAVGEDVNLSITFYTQRQKILFAQAIEQ